MAATVLIVEDQTAPFQPLGFIGKPFLPAEVLAAVERAVKTVSGS